MCHKIRCDRKSWKLFEFRGELNKALNKILSTCKKRLKGKKQRVFTSNLSYQLTMMVFLFKKKYISILLLVLTTQFRHCCSLKRFLFLGKKCLSHSLLYCSIKKGKLCWAAVYRTLLQSNQSDGWSKERGDRSLAEQQETRHSCAKISHLFHFFYLCHLPIFKILLSLMTWV